MKWHKVSVQFSYQAAKLTCEEKKPNKHQIRFYSNFFAFRWKYFSEKGQQTSQNINLSNHYLKYKYQLTISQYLIKQSHHSVDVLELLIISYDLLQYMELSNCHEVVDVQILIFMSTSSMHFMTQSAEEAHEKLQKSHWKDFGQLLSF